MLPPASEVTGLLRFAAGLRPFLRDTVSAEQAKAIVLRDMRDRDARFLRKVETAVFGNPRSPYRKLLQHAGCEPGDVQAMVARDGIEGALTRLRDAGVYVTFEEFKGLAPARRGSQTFAFAVEDFDNPLTRPHFRGSTGGSSGRATRIRFDLEHVAEAAPHWALWFAAHGWADRPLVFWTPTHAGVANRHLLAAKIGKPYVKWFGDVAPEAPRDRLGANLVHALVRWAAGVSRPEIVPVHRAARVGAYLAGLLRDGQRPLVNTSPSEAIRICLAMAEQGRDLAGLTFLLGAEPTTPARRRAIEASGAAAVPYFGFSEGGHVGAQCPNGADDDIHVWRDAYALIQRRREVGDGEPVDALLFTALRPACPKVLLNTEIGDYGVLQRRACGCPLDALGYNQHLHALRSFDKLTGVGMTFVGADLFELLEGEFPQRFGGSAGDYQLLEEQDANGLPVYRLLVSPEVGPLDDAALVDAFLDALAAMRNHYRYMVTAWREADVLRVERRRPEATARGKVLPFRTLA
jgi:hypothetical protein